MCIANLSPHEKNCIGRNVLFWTEKHFDPPEYCYVSCSYHLVLIRSCLSPNYSTMLDTIIRDKGTNIILFLSLLCNLVRIGLTNNKKEIIKIMIIIIIVIIIIK